jgi:hypothetical protein
VPKCQRAQEPKGPRALEPENVSKTIQNWLCCAGILYGVHAHHAEGLVDPKVDERQNGFQFWIPQIEHVDSEKLNRQIRYGSWLA